MEFDAITAHTTQAFQRFYSLLPRTNDPVLLILKAHLLIEEQLRLLIDERVVKPDAIAKAHLDCFQIICMAESFCADEAPPKLWDLLRKLNTLRNDIAHKLEPKGVRDRIEYITSLLGAKPRDSIVNQEGVEHDPLADFSFALSLLFTSVAAIVKRRVNSQE